jgi:hypothetical protein
MEVSVKIERQRRHTRSVYVDGRRIKSGLTQAEADEVIRKIINEDFARPRV